jgi:putative DNA primase/helicase
MENSELVIKDDHIEHYDMARYLMTKYTFKTMKDTDEILFFDPKQGCYIYGGSLKIKREVHSLLMQNGLSNQSKKTFINEVIAFIQRETYSDRSNFNSLTKYLNLGNGILDISNGKLYPHNHKFLSTIRIPVNYDEKAECPVINKFLSQIVTAEHVQMLIELFAWCLDLDSHIQRFVILVGEGSNGKSTFIRLLREFIGKENCTAITLQSLTSNRFASSDLFGKLVNLYPDLPTNLIKDTGPLKALTGGDAITAERKFERGFTFVNTAKLIFSANKPPEIEDDSYAIWRRMVIVEFPYQFKGANRDSDLIDKLTVPEELSGLLNLAKEKLTVLRQQGDFSYNQNWQEIRSKYNLISNPVTEFIENICNLDPLAEVPKPILYKAYREFSISKAIPLETSRGFGRIINREYPRNIISRGNNWMGIAFKKNWRDIISAGK